MRYVPDDPDERPRWHTTTYVKNGTEVGKLAARLSAQREATRAPETTTPTTEDEPT